VTGKSIRLNPQHIGSIMAENALIVDTKTKNPQGNHEGIVHALIIAV